MKSQVWDVSPASPHHSDTKKDSRGGGKKVSEQNALISVTIKGKNAVRAKSARYGLAMAPS